METVIDWKSPVLTEAMLVWTGWEKEAYPHRDDSRVLNHFGAKAGAELLPVLHSLAREFYMTDARDVADGLQEMGTIAAEQFKKKHPEVADEIVEALVWCYTFDFR